MGNESEHRGKANRLWAGLRLWLQRLILAFLGLFLFLYIAVQVPAIQNWIVDTITAQLSDALQTRVEIDQFRLGFFNRLRLEGVYVEDLNRDTLLYSERLTAFIDLSPITLFRKGLVIDELALTTAEFSLHREADETFTNLEALLNKLRKRPPGEKKKKKTPLSIDLDRVRLADIQFRQQDELKGKLLEIGFRTANIGVNEISLLHNRIDVEFLRIDRPVVRVNDNERSPLWRDSISLLPPTESAATDSNGLKVEIAEVLFENGSFELHNYRKDPVKLTPDDMLDYRHMQVEEIRMQLTDFRMDPGLYFQGRIDGISFRDLSGFVLNELSAKEATVTPEGFQLYDMQIVTPTSRIGDTLIFRYDEYPAFESFEDRVIMDARLNVAEISFEDIITFVPNLNNNTFFNNNRRERLELNGRMFGTVNNLSGRDLNIRLADGSRIKGRFSSRNLAVRNGQSMNMRLEEFRTSMRTLRELVPNFNPPENFDRLGRLRFDGSFDGFFVDFVAYGNLQTDIGDARMDMRMNVAEGREKANYSGTLALNDFDLGVWTGNTDFGKVSFSSRVANGVGITAQTANADLSATISSFIYKGYSYENADLAGRLQANRFDGRFSIEDENIDFSFAGQLDLTQGVPRYDFEASVNHLDLRNLNITQKEYVLAGDISLDLRNERIPDLEGFAILNEFSVRSEGTTYRVDSIALRSAMDTAGIKTLRIASDLFDLNFEGIFDADKIHTRVLQYLHRNHPGFSRKLKLPVADTISQPFDFAYDIRIKDSKSFNRLIDPNLGPLSGIRLQGRYSDPDNALLADLEAPDFRYGNIDVDDVVLVWDALDGAGTIDFGVFQTVINEKTTFSPVTTLGLLDHDTLTFSFNYAARDPEDPLANLALDGDMYILDSNLLRLELENSKLVVLQAPWAIREDNQVTIGKDSLAIENFVLQRQDQEIHFQAVGTKGIQGSLSNLDFNDFNQLIDFKPIRFGGKGAVTASCQDIFRLAHFNVNLTADTLKMNDEDWGEFRVDGYLEHLKAPLYVYSSLTKDTSQLILEGHYNTRDYGSQPEKARGYFDLSAQIHALPLHFSEYFIGSTLNDTEGAFDAQLQCSGQFSNPSVSGNIFLGPGAFTVSYLKTRYSFDRSLIEVDNYLFDATGVQLRDKYGHIATLEKGIRHDHLSDFGFDADLRTDRFLGLDTKKGDNKLFYGHALGSGRVSFSGSFQQPNVYVNAGVGDSTRIFIPVSSEREASELSFIRFVDKRQEKKDELAAAANLLKGVELDMDLAANEEAVLQIIFDEQAGDVIEGRGRGALRISVPRSGNFQMFGDYEIETGDYLFTLYNVINKKFSIQKGGRITWTGDPYGAEINLEATYSGLNVSLGNFIQEYLISASADLKRQAAQSTPVNLGMQLYGPLLRPNINFDIEFPQLVGELETYAESKLRVLKQDQNELNKQVFGLIVAGQFLPTDFALQGADIIYNTVSEFISNQLSLLITELFSEFIGDGQTLSSIDFDIAYSQYQSVDPSGGQDFSRGNELQVSLKQNFFNDRLSILVGGNIDLGGNIQATPNTSGAFVGNDLIIEYVLTDDRSLKLRIYQKLQPDIGGRRLQVGTGLSFRREFNSFSEFLESLRKDSRNKGIGSKGQ